MKTKIKLHHIVILYIVVNQRRSKQSLFEEVFD